MNNNANDFNKMCRACTGVYWNDNLKSFFDELISDNIKTNLKEIFLTCTGIKVVEDDGLPSSICPECLNEITKAYSFRQKCLKSNKYLRHIAAQNDTHINHSSIYFKTQESINTNAELKLKNENLPKTDSHDINESNIADEKSPFKSIIELHISSAESQVVRKTNRKVQSRSGEKYSPDPKYNCPATEKTFKSKRNLSQKVKACNKGDKPLLQCTICDKLCSSYGSLSMHKRSHKQLKNYECSICGSKFYQESNLKKHVEHHNLTDAEKSLKCPVCNRGFTRNNSLKLHMKSHKPKVEKTYTCKDCQKEFTQRGALNVHLLKHSGNRHFLCNECGKSFFQLYNLQQHIMTHREEKPFQCSECQKFFATSTSLRNHSKIHSGHKPYVCEQCGKGFIRSADLVVHTNFHLGIKPIKCSVCPRKLATSSHLIVHMRTHTGEKPHICDVCNRGFGARSTLIKHKLTHTGEKPYVCNVCGRAFSQTGSLKTHMKTHMKK